MRELEHRIDEALRKGLRADRRNPSNISSLVECLGWRCGALGLEAYIPESDPLQYDQVASVVTWPFPQFINQDKHKIVVVRHTAMSADYVYRLDDSYNVLQTITINWGVYGQGGLMEVADFGEYILMTNGVAIIYWDTTTDQLILSGALTTIPLMNTICNFKGQLVGGGIKSDWMSCDEHYIVWSKIGEASFEPDRFNEAGFRRDPHGGEILNVRMLGDSIVVYSTKGITLMAPVVDPIVTFGYKELMNVGLINQGAIAGSKDKHIFVDFNRSLWEITNKGIQNLGYEEYLENLTNGDVIVNYCSVTGDYYISDGSITYLLSPNGMSEIQQHPSAVWIDSENIYLVPDTIDDIEPIVVTDTVDFGYRSMKTIFSMEAGIQEILHPQCAVDWKNKPIDPWRRTDWIPLNDQAIATIIIGGNDFRLCFKCESVDEEAKLDYIRARWKMTDLRGLRGIYAAPPRGQEE